MRVDDAFDRVLRDRAAELGIGHCELARRILEQHLAGARTVSSRRPRVAIAAADRALLQEFNRHAARLTGALIQGAKSARLGGMAQYHAALEHSLGEVRQMRAVLGRLLEALEP